MGAGGGGGPQAESLELRLPQRELGGGRPLPAPTSEACRQVPCPSPPTTSAPPRPTPHLEQLSGEVAAFVEALQVTNEVSAGHALPDVLMEGTEASELGESFASQALRAWTGWSGLPPASPPTHVAVEIRIE